MIPYFYSQNYSIYVFKIYSVHLQTKEKDTLLKLGYIYVGNRVGITRDIQINDINLHTLPVYQELKMFLMMEQPASDVTKILRHDWEEIMVMLNGAMNSVKTDVKAHINRLWVTIKLDGTKTYLISPYPFFNRHCRQVIDWKVKPTENKDYFT